MSFIQEQQEETRRQKGRQTNCYAPANIQLMGRYRFLLADNVRTVNCNRPVLVQYTAAINWRHGNGSVPVWYTATVMIGAYNEPEICTGPVHLRCNSRHYRLLITRCRSHLTTDAPIGLGLGYLKFSANIDIRRAKYYRV